MHLPRKAASLAALLCAPACAHLSGQHAIADFHQVAGPAAIIEMHNTAGTITVVPWNQGTIEIDARKRAASLSDAQNMAIDVAQQGSRLVITSEFGTNFQGRSVIYTIHAPSGTALELHQSAGEINVNDWSASVDAFQTAGDTSIGMTHLDKPIHVSAHTTVGNVSLDMPRKASASIRASASIGAIDGSLQLVIIRHLTSAQASGTVGSGAAPVELDVSTGNVTVNQG